LLTNALKEQGIDYEINDIETECEFISLAEFKKDTNFGTLNEFLKNRNADKQGNDLFIYDPRITDASSVTTRPADSGTRMGTTEVAALTVSPSNALSLNSPFRHCGVNNDAAIYEIKGNVNLGALNKLDGRQDLQIVMTIDLIPTQEDKLKILGTNNRFLEVVLVIDPGDKNAEAIEFNLEQINTLCKDTAFSDEPLRLGS
jgi:hypothetical protein